MAVQIYKRQRNNSIGDAIIAGTQGFVGGRKLRQDTEDQSLANAYRIAQTRELEAKLGSLNQPLAEGFVRVGTDIKEDPTYYNPGKEREKARIKSEEDARAFQMFQNMSSNGGVPVGTTMRQGRFTIPVNPKLTGEEQSAVSTLETFKPQKEEIVNQVNQGALDSPLGNAGRTVRQFRADSSKPIMTAGDPKLQALQSNINSIRRYAFGEGGKNLTGTEKGIIDSLLNITGKSNEQIGADYDKALSILENKNKLVLGGANASRGGANLPRSAPVFNSPEEAEASGYKGEVIIAGRKAVIE